MEIDIIRKDFLSLIDLEDMDEITKKQLLKAVLNNFFDYLKEKSEKI